MAADCKEYGKVTSFRATKELQRKIEAIVKAYNERGNCPTRKNGIWNPSAVFVQMINREYNALEKKDS